MAVVTITIVAQDGRTAWIRHEVPEDLLTVPASPQNDRRQVSTTSNVASMFSEAYMELFGKKEG